MMQNSLEFFHATLITFLFKSFFFVCFSSLSLFFFSLFFFNHLYASLSTLSLTSFFFFCDESSKDTTMPKANKHAEVKPSKYKTSLCQFFLKGEECPYAGRCAFAHGEHELQTESRNVEVLKATGLQRLDGVPPLETKEVKAVAVAVNTAKTPSSASTNSFTASITSESPAPSEVTAPTSPLMRPRRRTVMVSLPKHNTRSETYQSPYNAQKYDPCYSEASRAEFGYPTQQPIHVFGGEAAYVTGFSGRAAHDSPYCDCRFSATCNQGQPLKYRHNPYGMTGRIPQCA